MRAARRPRALRPAPRAALSVAVGTAALAAALAGCTVGPDFHPPAPDAPPHWAPKPQDVPGRTVEGPVDAHWWAGFGDPELSSLVDRLLRGNLDLQAAAERIDQARAQRRIARSEGLPHIDGRGGYRRQRISENGRDSLLQTVPGAPPEFDVEAANLQASWELDLFGRVRRQVEGARAEVDAAQEDRRGVQVSAVAELAQSYLQLRGVQAREAVVRRNLQAADVRRRLVQVRLAQGVATLSDIAQADAQASTIGEDLPTLVAQEGRLVNAIGLLLALPPGALHDELSAPSARTPSGPPTVPTGLPSQLLRRRPDIRLAEARLHAATARTGVAVADFYPDLSLTGTYGQETLDAGLLFASASRAFMVGPTLTLPIFRGGQLRGALEMRRAQEREAAVGYRRAVLRAFRDVDDALTDYVEVQHRLKNVEGVERDDATALRVAQQRYVEGVETFIDVTVAQAELFRAQDARAQARTDLNVDLVTLYRALGGGWEGAAHRPGEAHSSAPKPAG